MEPLLHARAETGTGAAGIERLLPSISLMYEYQPEPTKDTMMPETDHSVATKPPNSDQPVRERKHVRCMAHGHVQRCLTRQQHMQAGEHSCATQKRPYR